MNLLESIKRVFNADQDRLLAVEPGNFSSVLVGRTERFFLSDCLLAA
jgi:hypothetical protein